ncbi:citryl-CoA lyase [Microbacterium sp. cx-55]|uniref:citryl-CoA lyase n=1 Tax=unclassified Microbacterium TaxID=2609290 RepID=UPI001CBBBF39|nr:MULTISPECIES: citryl-CoA lyase [unclassified Microbacterium]MBZ4487222.1 citryl-CoA lyase [Microbacterium sp. cx-55]MCC4908660.1 citryl-CoA lyase [Microbacterium sp. cx-59]UGB35246.1 citryl-CoA lyase [Microbacterium sp. cx-55]
MTDYPTGIGTSDLSSISLLGQDLSADLLGKVTFGELAFWLVAKRPPTAAEGRVFEAVLVSLADHGFTPTAIAARLTYYSAPDSLQGAVAAGLLGGGSRFLGVTEDTGLYLDAIVQSLTGDTAAFSDAEWDQVARTALLSAKAEKRRIPGLGHPVHKDGDPRTPVIMRIAAKEGTLGPHLRLFAAIGRVQHEVLGKNLPLNGAGVAGAALADLGLPVTMLRGFALLARTAGLLGHIREEQVSPIGPDVYYSVDRNAVYVPPAPASGETDASGEGA